MKSWLSCTTAREEEHEHHTAPTTTTPSSTTPMYADGKTMSGRKPQQRSPPSLPQSGMPQQRSPTVLQSGTPQQRYPPVHQKPGSRQSVEDKEVTVLLIGRTGNGKSSTGNSMLGRAVFAQTMGFLSATQHTQLGEARRSHGNTTVKLQVVDLPDITSDMDDSTAARELQHAMTLAFPYPSAICVVVRADVRFTPEEHASYRRTMELVQGQMKTARGRMVVVFTMADRLPAQLREGFKDQLQQASSELRQLLQDACGRYVLLGNLEAAVSNDDAPLSNRNRLPGQRDKGTDTEGQLSQLLGFVLRLHHSSPPGDCLVPSPGPVNVIHVTLLGAAGGGKSATGNTLAHPHHPFSVHRGMASASSGDRRVSITVRGFQLQILDTVDHPDDDPLYDRWRARLQTRQHVLLLVLSANQRFDSHHTTQLANLRALLGSDVVKHVIVVLTWGDALAEEGTSVEEAVRQSPSGLRTLLQQVEGRYVVLDNHSPSLTKRLLYRNTLLQAIVQLKHKNKDRVLRLPGRSRRPQEGVSSSREETSSPPLASPPKSSSMYTCVVS